MARRLMSRRGNSASQPQVTPYQQLELDDGWREWENTKQELVLVKRQLTEKDALILQLKTASRRLQETLRKKDKDLQTAFAILRSPQDAKTTKTRKQELVDRLVSECMQRAVTSEALAEERRRELDRLKYSSKFLRFQELEIEIEECHSEIDRLRAKLETTAAASPTAIAGKLKVSAMPLTTNVYTGTLLKKTKLEPLNLQEQVSPDSRQNERIPTMNSTQSATGQVRVVPLAKYDYREGFVSKTRRRALEAEYYKQVRLAQLEVECELEENLHIRAAREVQRLEATELQERQTDFIINSARTQRSTSRNNDLDEEDVERADAKDREVTGVDKADELPEKLETVEEHVSEEPATNTPGCEEANMEVQSEKKTYEDAKFDENDGISDDHCKETGYGSVWNANPKPHYNPEPYQKENGGATDDNFKETSPSSIWNVDPNPHNDPEPYQKENSGATNYNFKETDPGSIWNVDPNPHNDPDPYQKENSGATNDNVKETDPGAVWNVDPERNGVDMNQSAQDNGESNMKSAAWNVNPEPSGEGGPDRVIWNADPNPGDPDTPVDDAPVVYSDDEDDDHEAAEEQNNSVSSDDNSASNVWNLPLHTEEKSEDPVVSHEAEADSVQEDSNGNDDNDHKEVWNVDPMPPSYEHHAPTNTTENSTVEVNQSVWNLNPDVPVPAVPDATSSYEVQNTHDDANDEVSPEAVASAAKEIVDADSSSGEDPNPVAANPSSNTENGANPWNLEPKPSTPPSSNPDEGQSVDIPVHTDTSGGGLSSGAENDQAQADHDDLDNGTDTNTVWNLAPSVTEPVSKCDSEGEDNSNSVWNLDPHTGDASEPQDTCTVVTTSELVQEDEDASTPRSKPRQLEYALTEDVNAEKESPAESSSNYDDGTEAPAVYPSEVNNPSSAREYEDDATPEYTPPSTARDSDAADDDDPTW